MTTVASYTKDKPTQSSVDQNRLYFKSLLLLSVQIRIIIIDYKAEMATQDFQTSAAKAFREHYDKLVDSIQEPDLPGLGNRFFSRQIISRETLELVGNVTTSRVVRASKLILAVMTHLELHPDKFETALEVFREELVYFKFSILIGASIGNTNVYS